MYYPCDDNYGADQLRSYFEADLRLCFRICKMLQFSHDAAHIMNIRRTCTNLMGIKNSTNHFNDTYTEYNFHELWLPVVPFA